MTKITRTHKGIYGYIEQEGKVLANKGYDDKKQEWFYRLPGGGIDFFEKAEDTLRREFKEENNLDIIVQEQLGFIENLFEFNGKKGHEVCFIFRATLSDADIKKDKFPRIETPFEGCCTEFIDIKGPYKIYPEEALKFIKKN